MIKPILSIIIVSYNTADITINCLRSILTDKGLKNIPYEIIIIDNNSKDNSVNEIKKTFTRYISNFTLKIIKNSCNLGFGKANNQGLKIAQGNYILFLNSDTIVLHSSISQALDWLCSHPEAAACTAQLLNKDKTIQASGGFFPNLANMLTWSLGLDDLPGINYLIKPFHPHPPKFYTHDSFYLRDHQQDWITGAFMLIRRELLDKIGGFDENYFMYGEEVELAYRLKQITTNNQIWYLVGPQIIHFGRASAADQSQPILNEYRGVLAFFKKHKPYYQFVIAQFLIKTNAWLRSLIRPVYRRVYQQL
ncbi:MAG TPA: glycosyltransferase family 2 protein [Candidatus Woesebacteria bacterium]|nr:glycosyltransferase family 2 protein [Candidatus Woesebacteria bacterium]